MPSGQGGKFSISQFVFLKYEIYTEVDMLKEVNLLAEMTMRGGNFDIPATEYVKAFEKHLNNFTHIADIEDFKVMKWVYLNVDTFFLLLKDEKIVCFAKVQNKDNLKMVRNIWTDKEFRGKGLLSKLLWFFKTRLNYSKMVLGDMHSHDTQQIVKGGLSKFEKFWYKDGKQEPFSLQTLDTYYNDSKPTGWLVMLENDGQFDNWPMFKGTDFCRDNYDMYIE